jgi:uncharacterized C2H2 Zn-finger protein
MEHLDPVTCRSCGAGVAIRINRNGFLQRKVFGRLGFYPWKCGACGTVFLYHRRYDRHRSSRHPSQSPNQSPQT